MSDRYQPKPDDRSDNVEKLQEMVQDTIQNIEKAHETMQFSSGEEKEAIKEKNKRREQAIEGMRQEIKDEYENQH
ncbi:small, acid-soluble spore protein Tlp [Virgibacillus pantothenticus]|uniref:Small, acid-soluble spore protein Tlp n=1 Tax=Virgibacillus pantothenticus TaxID=1473 RepID=A0A0L0QNZ9_VIRPA|nr:MULTISPECIES: small acid-soluble spore protein Tlp [Virgibacillus]API94027.1 small acid-soluble spore protein Tlp [Virgibacillus sp. 6R]KNE20279.1 small acid-soluble spore protein Tlp [Virgibacillus pantothenticus]MBS7429396.1 small acid-soluble spore protein Tlp [Virgibacillus sp. 19R1-5]MBU8568087.1 small acid-soluble spore protein Tlp [Virgibacillus pantothenticus]MBU8602033.1 small acid-soluble spore protein Tlp [Virgibacillus pantothenticus]